ncbi:hypothetical protein AWENTII_012178 [Aspergillus wentii]
MEPHNLEAASTYINNVLLARGLLKGGTPIDFAHPECDEGGADATMARIINLMNDLVLRRDREADHRESLATTIRTLRGNESQQTLEIARLRTKTSELTRSVALAEAQDRASKTNLSNAEGTIRGLKEQVQRMKTNIQQIRGQCANDIRKRDLEMQKLKSHLAERQRGKREGLGVTTININPATDRGYKTRSLAGGEGVHHPGYSLKEETNDFLTELCQNLSDENDTLIVLARNTVQMLKDLQGITQVEEDGEEVVNGVASFGTHKSSRGPVTTLPTSCEDLSGQMDMVLDHLRTLLTNPSFVPLEEVEVRDDEIKRLREGWEKMEARWRQAVTMMDGWHKRIADGGDSIHIEELKMGMGLDSSTGADRDAETDGEVGTSMDQPIFEDREAEEEEEQQQQEEKVTERESRSRPEPETASNDPPQRTSERTTRRPPSRALKERSDNIRPTSRLSRKVSFTPGLQGSPCEPSGEDDTTLQAKAHASQAMTRRPLRRRLESKASQPGSNGRLSVSEKLAAAETEARAAEQARKESETRKRSRGGAKGPSSNRGTRRRSTLTHGELDELMGMSPR